MALALAIGSLALLLPAGQSAYITLPSEPSRPTPADCRALSDEYQRILTALHKDVDVCLTNYGGRTNTYVDVGRSCHEWTGGASATVCRAPIACASMWSRWYEIAIARHAATARCNRRAQSAGTSGDDPSSTRKRPAGERDPLLDGTTRGSRGVVRRVVRDPIVRRIVTTALEAVGSMHQEVLSQADRLDGDLGRRQTVSGPWHDVPLGRIGAPPGPFITTVEVPVRVLGYGTGAFAVTLKAAPIEDRGLPATFDLTWTTSVTSSVHRCGMRPTVDLQVSGRAEITNEPDSRVPVRLPVVPPDIRLRPHVAIGCTR